MTAHIALLIYVSLCGVFVYTGGKTKETNKRFLILALLGVFLLEALRKYTVGADTNNYYFAFWRIKFNTYRRVVAGWEPLYFYMNKCVGMFTNDPQWIIVLSSLIITCGLGIFIYENVDERQPLFWQIFIFITFHQYFCTMNLLRQCIAMAISCNVYTILRKGKSKKDIIRSILLIIIARYFHTSGLVAILFFVPFFIEMDKKKFFFGLIGVIILFFAYPFLFRIFLRLFPRYNMYNRYYESGGGSNSYLLFGAIDFFMALLCILYIDPTDPDNKECYRLLYFVLLSLAMLLIQIRNPLMTRLGYYFQWFIILFIPEVIRRWTKSAASRFMIKYVLYLGGWLFFIYSMNVGFVGRSCVPYLFFWQ